MQDSKFTRKYKSLVILVIILIMFMLTACGNKSETSEGDVPNPSESIETPDVSDEPNPPDTNKSDTSQSNPDPEPPQTSGDTLDPLDELFKVTTAPGDDILPSDATKGFKGELVEEYAPTSTTKYSYDNYTSGNLIYGEPVDPIDFVVTDETMKSTISRIRLSAGENKSGNYLGKSIKIRGRVVPDNNLELDDYYSLKLVGNNIPSNYSICEIVGIIGYEQDDPYITVKAAYGLTNNQ